MGPRDWFGVFLRGLGVYQVVLATYYSFFVFIKLAGASTNSTAPILEDKLFAGYYFAVGLVLIILADQIVSLIYGPQSNTLRDTENPPAID